jgi:hypothetical protein
MGSIDRMVHTPCISENIVLLRISEERLASHYRTRSSEKYGKGGSRLKVTDC